jgi:hypothetical protein
VTKETPGQVAGVFLSQVPYTGIGSNIKITLFILALLSWSSWISYLIIKRKAHKSGLTVSQMFAHTNFMPVTTKSGIVSAHGEISSMKNKLHKSIPVMANIPRTDITLTPHEPKKPDTTGHSAFIPHMSKPEPQLKTQPVTPNVPTDNTFEKVFGNRTHVKTETTALASTEDISETLEFRARELQTVISADGLQAILTVSGGNRHNAVIILNHLVELYKDKEHEVEGEWLILNKEKISRILFSTCITMTPVFIEWLVRGDDRKVMSFIRMIQIQGQPVKDFITNIILELDKVHRHRTENTGDADEQILNSIDDWSHEELEQVIGTLVSAVDQTYSSTYASIKIALVKIIEMSKVKYYA